MQGGVTPTPEQSVGTVQSLERGLAVLRSFDTEHPRMTLADVSRRTGLTRATVRRFLHTLVHLGYTDTDGREFWLKPRVLELGYSYLSSSSLPEIATPHLKTLTNTTHESSSVSVLDGDEIVYVARVHTRRIMAVSINVGTRFPAYATSMGRVMLAALSPAERAKTLGPGPFPALTPNTITSASALEDVLETVREQGWCQVDQELELGLRSLSVPIRNRQGAVIAAANVSMTVNQATPAEIVDALLPDLTATAGEIERDLRSVG